MSYYNYPDRLKELERGEEGGVALAASFFENLIKRIEHIKPVAVGQSNNLQFGTPIIYVKSREGGDGREVGINAEYKTINVCSNGTPSTLDVLCRIEDEQTEPEPD